MPMIPLPTSANSASRPLDLTQGTQGDSNATSPRELCSAPPADDQILTTTA
jgi:hypothetical protein